MTAGGRPMDDDGAMAPGHDHSHGHSHGHSDGHSHGPSLARAGERHKGRLLIAFGIILTFFVVQVIAAFWTNSLALLSDAGHMLTDVIGTRDGARCDPARHPLRATQRGDSFPHTFGLYRLEILAAFVNSLLLFGVAIWVVVEAVRRLGNEPEVSAVGRCSSSPCSVSCANLVAFALLREGAKESLNIEGAYLEVLADTVGSVGVIVAAVLLSGVRVDVGRLGRRRSDRPLDPATHVATRSARRPDPSAVGAGPRRPRPARRRISRRSTVWWTSTTSTCGRSPRRWRPRRRTWSRAGARTPMRSSIRPGTASPMTYGVTHGTFQVEPDDHEGCDEVTW